MQNAWIWIVVAVVVLVGGFIWWQSMQSAGTEVNLAPIDTTVTPTPPPLPAATSTDTTTGETGATTAPSAVTVAYTSTGFSPQTVTVKKGGTVTWSGGSNMWVATGPHPAHTGYDGDTSSRTTHCAQGYAGAKPFDECAPGASYSFIFDKVGSWPYHDHMNASNFGKVVVVE